MAEGAVVRIKQTTPDQPPRKYIFYRCEKLSQLLKELNKKDIEPDQGLFTLTWVSKHLETLTLEAKGANQIT